MKKLAALAAFVLALSLIFVTTQVIAGPASTGVDLPGGTAGRPGKGPTPTGTIYDETQPPEPSRTPKPKKTPGAQATLQATKHAQQSGKPDIYRGTIAAVDASSLTLTLGDGSSVTIGLNADTKIRVPGPKAQGDTLLVGMQAIAWTKADANGNPLARAVMVIPGQPERAHRVGTVTAYTSGLSITIQATDGNSYTFALTADTKILPADRAASLAVGSFVTIIAPRDPSALGLNAVGIVVHPPQP